jgi:5-methylcytosine-specific restriction enzyme subunit McrC
MMNWKPMNSGLGDKPTLRLNEWQSINQSEFVKLVGEKSLSNSDISLSKSLSEKQFIDIIEHKNGISIKTKSYVGRLSFDSFNLQIDPKLNTLPLISFFRYGYGLKNIHLFGQHILQTESLAIQDILIQQLLSEIKQLVQRGLFLEYRRKIRSLSAIRGRIDFKRYFSTDSTASTVIPCIYYPRTLDNPLNQFIWAGLQFSSRIASDSNLKFECLRFAEQVGTEITEQQNLSVLYKQVIRKKNRLNSQYQPAIQLIHLLWQGYGAFSEGDDKGVFIPGFLFDMNMLFQNVISKYLNENLKGFIIFDEYSLKGVMSYSQNFNPKPRNDPLLRPDFIIKEGKATIAVLDAKYRDIWEKGLPREMLYQLGIYALVHSNVKGSTILYPTTHENASEERISIHDPISRDNLGKVTLRPIHLNQLNDCILMPSSKLNDRIKSQYAKYMVFGQKA